MALAHRDSRHTSIQQYNVPISKFASSTLWTLSTHLQAATLLSCLLLGAPTVINGASNLLGKVFADKGLHARSALGTNSLPLNVCVEIEAVVEVEEESSSSAKRPLDTAAADSSSAKK
eukprot:8609-Heterococcus_DN1.PRE.3